MTNILTAQQAANAVRVDTTDLRMLDLLPQVDLFIQNATGRDWTQDSTKNPTAVSAATMLLVQWFDDPGQVDLGRESIPPFGLTAALTQLESEALKYRSYQFAGRNGVGAIHLHSGEFENEALRYRAYQYGAWPVSQGIVRAPFLHGVHKGDVVIKLVGVSGVTGSQADKFEATISEAGFLQQTSASDLSNNLYVVILKSPADDIVP
jgi:hypothetical protein